MSEEMLEEVAEGAEAAGAADETLEGAEDLEAGDAGAEPEETGEKETPKDWPETAIKTVGRLRAARREAREQAAAAESELEQARADLEKLNAKYSDRDVMAAAKKLGFAAELMTAEDIKLVDRAETLEVRLERLEETLEDHPDGYEDGEGKAVTPQMLHKWLRQTRRELKEIEDDAAALRKQKAVEAREIWKLGQAARKAGWKPGQKPAAGTAKAPPVKAKVGAGAASAAHGGAGSTIGGAQRRAATVVAAKGAADFSKVKTRDELVAEMAKEYGG
jgi:hypothetical protein